MASLVGAIEEVIGAIEEMRPHGAVREKLGKARALLAEASAPEKPTAKKKAAKRK
jgi:hypothetical protein